MQEEAPNKFTEFEVEKPTNVLKIASAGLRLIKEQKVIFDHHLCEKIIGYREMPGDRCLRPAHVQYLISAMMRGTFHPEWVRFIVCQWDSQAWRMNGQHCAMARLEMPAVCKEIGSVGLMFYEADTFEAMRELYASIDRGAPRTRANILSSYLADTEQFADSTPTMVKLLGTALTLWLWEGTHEKGKHDADEVAYLMQHQHKALVCTVMAFCQEEPKVLTNDYMRRGAVVAAMFETFTKVYQPSVDFWTAVRSGIGFDSADDPRLRLRNFLMTVKMGADAKQRTVKLDGETIYRICINAFNRWRAGEKVKVLLTTKERQRAK